MDEGGWREENMMKRSRDDQHPLAMRKRHKPNADVPTGNEKQREVSRI